MTNVNPFPSIAGRLLEAARQSTDVSVPAEHVELVEQQPQQHGVKRRPEDNTSSPAKRQAQGPQLVTQADSPVEPPSASTATAVDSPRQADPPPQRPSASPSPSPPLRRRARWYRYGCLPSLFRPRIPHPTAYTHSAMLEWLAHSPPRRAIDTEIERYLALTEMQATSPADESKDPLPEIEGALRLPHDRLLHMSRYELLLALRLCQIHVRGWRRVDNWGLAALGDAVRDGIVRGDGLIVRLVREDAQKTNRSVRNIVERYDREASGRVEVWRDRLGFNGGPVGQRSGD